MPSHRFRIGQVVQFQPSLRASSPDGAFKIDQLLPPTGAHNQYRVTSTRDGHQRVCIENELVPT